MSEKKICKFYCIIIQSFVQSSFISLFKLCLNPMSKSYLPVTKNPSSFPSRNLKPWVPLLRRPRTIRVHVVCLLVFLSFDAYADDICGVFGVKVRWVDRTLVSGSEVLMLAHGTRVSWINDNLGILAYLISTDRILPSRCSALPPGSVNLFKASPYGCGKSLRSRPVHLPTDSTFAVDAEPDYKFRF